MSARSVVALSIACVVLGALTAPQAQAARKVRIDQGPNAEVTFDGLHRVKRVHIDEAWVKPDIDLSGYDKLIIDPVGVSYRAVKEPAPRNYRGGSDNAFPISQRNRNKLESTLRKAFLRELDKVERFELVTRSGPQTLVLEIAFIDVVSRIPPPSIGRVDIYLTEVGEATMVLQLRDAQSGEILLRAVDRRTAESVSMFKADSISTWMEVRRLAEAWAKLVRKRLNDVGSYVVVR